MLPRVRRTCPRCAARWTQPSPGPRGLITSADTQALPATLRGVAEDAGALVNAPEIAALLADLPMITADIRAITAELREAQAALALTQALDAASRAASAVADGTENLPRLSASAERVMAQVEDLATNLNTLTDKANALALDELVNATTDLMTTADVFLSSDEAGDVPVVLSETLQELRRTIAQIRTGGTLDNLDATLSSTASAAGQHSHRGTGPARADQPAAIPVGRGDRRAVGL